MSENQERKYHTKEEAWLKLQRYCAYQDRCHAEVRTKLLAYGIFGDDLEEIMAGLVNENFLNEERFARSFARGKFRLKSWGRLKITGELKKRKISDYLIRKALEEIPEEEYLPQLRSFLQRKLPLIRTQDAFARRQKLASYAIRRGFESEYVWALVNELVGK